MEEKDLSYLSGAVDTLPKKARVLLYKLRRPSSNLLKQRQMKVKFTLQTQVGFLVYWGSGWMRDQYFGY